MSIEVSERPLVSFVLLAYNQERFIREAVQGALGQTYSPLQIILSDDCSPDGTFAVMQKIASAYVGPHEIILNRNCQNLGLGRHYSRVMEMARGEIVELAAGDDISLPRRTEDSVKILQANPELTTVSLGLIHFKDDAVPTPPKEEGVGVIKVYDLESFVRDVDVHLDAPARAFRKFTHDYFGPLSENCPVEDGPNLFRCLLHGESRLLFQACSVVPNPWSEHVYVRESLENPLREYLQ